MKYSALKSKQKKILIYLMIPVFIIGIVITIATLNSSKEAIYAEHDEHLNHLASAIDHNTSEVLNRCFSEVYSSISNDELFDAVKVYEETKDLSGIKAVLLNKAFFGSDNISRLLVLEGEKIIASSDETDSLNYEILDGTQNDTYWLCRDKSTGVMYFGVSYPAFVYGYSNTALIDIETLYQRAVAKSIYSSYWISLFDIKSGLILQNDGINANYFIFSDNAALEKEEEYIAMKSFQEGGTVGSKVFDTANGKTRLYVIPSQLSENDRFTIGVEINDEYITKPMTIRNIQMVIAALLIAFSAAFAMFFIMHSGKREEELALEISSLEKENELNQSLLSQQEELAHHQNLETIGTLTAGVAHEFNNLLSPIMSDSFLILERNPEDSDNYENALEVYNASKRAKDLVSKISRLSRKNPTSIMKLLSPNSLVLDALTVAKPSMPASVSVETKLESRSMMLGDEAPLEHMLLNLFINAFHAMELNGGVLTISTLDVDDKVEIRVQDQGCGIKEEILSSIFEPFFTTKEAGKGTGLGLAIVQRTVFNHGGTIEAVNNEDKGASFILRFAAVKNDNIED